jgi:hypothetical protein
MLLPIAVHGFVEPLRQPERLAFEGKGERRLGDGRRLVVPCQHQGRTLLWQVCVRRKCQEPPIRSRDPLEAVALRGMGMGGRAHAVGVVSLAEAPTALFREGLQVAEGGGRVELLGRDVQQAQASTQEPLGGEPEASGRGGVGGS